MGAELNKYNDVNFSSFVPFNNGHLSKNNNNNNNIKHYLVHIP
jgi:hypothetical protein